MRRLTSRGVFFILSLAIPSFAQESVRTYEDAPEKQAPAESSLAPSPAASASAPESTSAPTPEPGSPVAPTSTVAPAPASLAGFPSVGERMHLEDEVDRLEDERDERYSLGGPIAVMAIGGGLSLGGLVFLVQGLAIRGVVSASGTSGYGAGNVGSTLMVVGGIGMATGAGFLIGGGAWLGKRIQKRRPYNQRIDELESQADYYGSWRVQPLFGRSSLGLGVTSVF